MPRNGASLPLLQPSDCLPTLLPAPHTSGSGPTQATKKAEITPSELVLVTQRNEKLSQSSTICLGSTYMKKNRGNRLQTFLGFTVPCRNNHIAVHLSPMMVHLFYKGLSDRRNNSYFSGGFSMKQKGRLTLSISAPAHGWRRQLLSSVTEVREPIHQVCSAQPQRLLQKMTIWISSPDLYPSLVPSPLCAFSIPVSSP